MKNRSKNLPFYLATVVVSLGGLSLSADEPVSFEEAFSVVSPALAPDSESANPAGLSGRVMAGYQGWFRAPGDGSGMGFHHYTRQGKFEPGFATIDLWPDLSEFTEEEKFPTPFFHADGSVAQVFSSQHAKTVDRHFQWMKDYGLDGVFVQRFASVVTQDRRSEEMLRADNRKLMLCRDAANAHGRAWALMYDLSGWKPEDFELLARDWKNLRTQMQLGIDPNDRSYLHLNAKPLVAIWGVGFADEGRDYSLADAEKFIRFIKNNPEWGGVSVMLGVPYAWREQNRDATTEAGFHDVLKLADVISPWSVGRYHEVDFESGKLVDHLIEDRKWCESEQLTYLPVLFPGFSWHNLHAGEEALNAIPREGGRFLWDQFVATRAAGIDTAYIAMFDEIDEATAIFKCTNDPPVGEGVNFLTYEGLSSDHYLKLTGDGRRLLRGEIPTK